MFSFVFHIQSHNVKDLQKKNFNKIDKDGDNKFGLAEAWSRLGLRFRLRVGTILLRESPAWASCI